MDENRVNNKENKNNRAVFMLYFFAYNINNNKKFRSFKSKEKIHKKEVGPNHGFGYYSLISDPINLPKGARGKPMSK